jgi:hypothetical protein
LFLSAVCLLFSGALVSLNAQVKDSVIYLTLRLQDDKNGKPVQLAHVVNMRTERGGISDTSGYFRTRVLRGDMLRITAIGYFDHYVVIPDSSKGSYSVKLPMKEKVYLITEVRVNTLGNYDQFRNRFLNTEPSDKEAYALQKRYREMARDTGMKYAPLRTGIPLNFPSPEQRIEARKRELQRVLREERIINDKFSPRIVSILTGLRGDELFQFMQFCNFSKEFLLTNNHYDILVTTLLYFDQWKLQKQKREAELRRRQRN